MLRLQASPFILASSQIGQIHEQVRNGVLPVNSSWAHIAANLKELRVQCEQLVLSATVAQLERIDLMIADGINNVPMFTAALMEVTSRMNDELSARYVYCLDSKQATYIQAHQFAVVASDRFPDAIPDMEEAAKCYAFERPTACIFHLMRVTEYGINAIAKLLNIPDHNPTWEPIIRKIDAELKLDYKHRQYKGSQDLLANMSTHLHAVKVAWRNKTMHVEKINTMEHAKEIYDATCGLMRYLGENLPVPKRTATVLSLFKGKGA